MTAPIADEVLAPFHTAG